MAYLTWYEDWYKQIDDCEVGASDSPLDNPPKLSRGDLDAWNFYQTSATSFVQDFGLMPQLVNDLGLDEATKEILLRKLSLIHASMLKIQKKEMELKHG